MSLVIGTRASSLALWQAQHVKSLLEISGVREIQLKKITTRGDQILDRSLVELGGKGLFLKEIEEALVAGEIDLAVHSMKDVPFDLPQGLIIAAYLERENPSDALISRDGKKLMELEMGARVGTSSLRREWQLKMQRPDLNYVPLRGNVDTRLQKLFSGEYDAIVLATAGLKRLGKVDHITEELSTLPAVSQGVIGVECREDDRALYDKLRALNHSETEKCVVLERKFLKVFSGDCRSPIACHVKVDSENDEFFSLDCFRCEPDGTRLLQRNVRAHFKDAEKVLDDLVAQFQK